MRIVTCNANRLRDSDLMRGSGGNEQEEGTHSNMDRNTFRTSIEFEKIAEKKGYKTYSVTRWMKRYDSGSGGVTIMIDKQFQSKERKKSKMEDMLWVSMDVGKEKWFV